MSYDKALWSLLLLGDDIPVRRILARYGYTEHLAGSIIAILLRSFNESEINLMHICHYLEKMNKNEIYCLFSCMNEKIMMMLLLHALVRDARDQCDIPRCYTRVMAQKLRRILFEVSESMIIGQAFFVRGKFDAPTIAAMLFGANLAPIELLDDLIRYTGDTNLASIALAQLQKRECDPGLIREYCARVPSGAVPT